MAAISRLIVVLPRGDVLESLRFAFERDGTEISTISLEQGAAAVADLLGDVEDDNTARGHDAIIAGGLDSEAAAATLLGELRDAVKGSGLFVPIVYLGNQITLEDGVRAGATTVLYQPLFLRDVVVAAGLLSRRRRSNLARGELRDFGGMFFVVRALTHFHRSAVLTVVRGLRRGEIRFFEGAVTSAQVGGLHGLSALHHLVLWHVGTFELRFESVVQRRQIPMATPELLADVQRFLAEVHEAAGDLQFVGSYEANADKLLGVDIPQPIAEVLDLMDGSRTLPDLVEDSPFRMFDTLRIANRLADLGLVDHTAEVASGMGFRLRRRVEEMVLSESSSIPESMADETTGRTRRLAESELQDDMEESAGGRRTIDWSDVLPSSPNAEDKVAQVVPAAVAAGEITVDSGPVATTSGALGADASGELTDDENGSEALDGADDDGADDAELVDAPPSEEVGADDSPERTEAKAGEPREKPSLGASTSADEDADGAEPSSAGNDEPAGGDEPTNTAGMLPTASDEQREREETRETTVAGNAEDKSESSENDGSAEDALAFTEGEEAFFREGQELESRPPPPVDNFEDLDTGPPPLTFWQRLLGRRRRRGDSAAASERKSSRRDNGKRSGAAGSGKKSGKDGRVTDSGKGSELVATAVIARPSDKGKVAAKSEQAKAEKAKAEAEKAKAEAEKAKAAKAKKAKAEAEKAKAEKAKKAKAEAEKAKAKAEAEKAEAEAEKAEAEKAEAEAEKAEAEAEKAEAEAEKAEAEAEKAEKVEAENAEAETESAKTEKAAKVEDAAEATKSDEVQEPGTSPSREAEADATKAETAEPEPAKEESAKPEEAASESKAASDASSKNDNPGRKKSNRKRQGGKGRKKRKRKR